MVPPLSLPPGLPDGHSHGLHPADRQLPPPVQPGEVVPRRPAGCVGRAHHRGHRHGDWDRAGRSTGEVGAGVVQRRRRRRRRRTLLLHRAGLVATL